MIQILPEDKFAYCGSKIKNEAQFEVFVQTVAGIIVPETSVVDLTCEME